MRFPLPNASRDFSSVDRKRELDPYVRSPFGYPRAIIVLKVPVREHPALGCQKFDGVRLLRNVDHS